MGQFKRWMYRGDRPHLLARILNTFFKWLHSSGWVHNWATLEVIGRKSGKIISMPVVVAHVDGERYLVSMLGDGAQWVKNVRAADGKAFIRHGDHSEVRLIQVPPEESAPILKAYVQAAPGARPHIPVDKSQPVADFEAITEKFPAFRIQLYSGE